MPRYSTPARQFLTFLLATTVHAAAAQELDFGNFGGLGLGARKQEVSVRSQFTPAEADRPALLFVTATIKDGYHVNAVDQQKLPSGGPDPTTFQLAPDSAVRFIGPPRSIEPPHVYLDEKIFKGLELREHEGSVTWFIPFEIPAGTDLEQLVVAGAVVGQACSAEDGVCADLDGKIEARLGTGIPLPPGTTFEKAITPLAVSPAVAPIAAAPSAVADNTRTNVNPVPAPSEAAPQKSSPIVTAAPSVSAGEPYDLAQIKLEQAEDHSFLYYLVTAFLGGLILNVMPCVLPVIGLKVMSFVQQAGESRTRALLLNLWYSAGIISVFLGLAALAVTLRVGWGDQFGNAGFLIGLVAVVFAMALSLLGLWEIPIPGFVGSGAALSAAEREGAPAAFLKGILTTVLATPCTGPFMVAGTTWALRQPTHVTFSVFAALGLGMASPYLLVGAFPELLRFFPKPGMWMETFKKAMGLVLLATVAWLLSTLDPPLVVPTFALLVGVTAACWRIAQTPGTEPFSARLYSWSVAGLFTAIIALGCYGWLYRQVMLPREQKRLDDYAEQAVANSRSEIVAELRQMGGSEDLAKFVDNLEMNVDYEGDKPWQTFSLVKLRRLLVGDKRIVLVDFTADWCTTCKTLEPTVLKTDEVEQAIDRSGVVTMVADYTKKPQWLRNTIQALGGNGVPVIAVFSPDRPYQPQVFHGLYTKGGLIAAIDAAAGGNAPQTAAVPASQSPQ